MSMYHPSLSGCSSPPSAARRVGLVLALLLPPLVGSAGYGADMLRGYVVQAKLSRAVDAAAMAGGRVLFDDQRDGHIRKFFATAFPDGFLGAESAPLSITDDPRDGTLMVNATAVVRAGVLRLLGIGDHVIEARSVVRRPSRTGDPALVRRSA